ncbi:MAG: phosphatidylglycerol lysyltransferase domain-containing protein, partial [bacterium]
SYEEIINMNMTDFLKKFANANNKDIELWMSYYGYDYLIDNVQVSIWLFDKDYYTSKYTKLQRYVKTGIVTLVKKLFEHSNANIFYNFKGLYRFKAKFQPLWSPRYLVYPRGNNLLPIATAVVRAHIGTNILRDIISGIWPIKK